MESYVLERRIVGRHLLGKCLRRQSRTLGGQRSNYHEGCLNKLCGSLIFYKAPLLYFSYRNLIGDTQHKNCKRKHITRYRILPFKLLFMGMNNTAYFHSFGCPPELGGKTLLLRCNKLRPKDINKSIGVHKRMFSFHWLARFRVTGFSLL